MIGKNNPSAMGAGRPGLARQISMYLLSAPLTFGYLTVLLITSSVLASASARSARRLLLQHSTNLHQLARDPVRVLISSAFWLTNPWQLPIWIALFAVVMATVERRIGSLRTGVTFGIGHIGATLVTAGGLWLAVRVDLADRSVVNARTSASATGFSRSRLSSPTSWNRDFACPMQPRSWGSPGCSSSHRTRSRTLDICSRCCSASPATRSFAVRPPAVARASAGKAEA